MRAVDKSISIP